MKLGVVGYGKRISNFLDSVFKYDLEAEVTAIADIDREGVLNRLNQKRITPEKITFYEDADKMLDEEELDGVLVGTRCSLHTGTAVKVLQRNLPLFLEKPVATCMADLIKLEQAAENSTSEVLVSFPLRFTPMIKLAKEIIQSGKLGTIEHVQAVNNVPYGGVYYHHWYRNESETGGLFIQKATHDFDYINYLLGIRPSSICAVTSKQIFRGDRPAGLSCADCSENETCPEGPFVTRHFRGEEMVGEMCCFARDTGNEDSGSALIKYETGMHVSYSQNFFARKGAASRGSRLLGYKGTLEFNWYTDELKVFMHHTSRVETYKLDASNLLHFGGDLGLAYNFINMLRGREKSIAPIDSGLLSTLMCLKASESAKTNTFQEIYGEKPSKR